MKVLDELELRESLLLNYRERVCLSDKMADSQRLNEVDDALFLLGAKIFEVKRDKRKFIYYPADMLAWLSSFDGAYQRFYLYY